MACLLYLPVAEESDFVGLFLLPRDFGVMRELGWLETVAKMAYRK